MTGSRACTAPLGAWLAIYQNMALSDLAILQLDFPRLATLIRT
jgi:hypothetical protein